MVGYFQTQSWFWEKPWLDTISLWVLDHSREQTCDLVSMVLRHVPVWVFQKRMVRSAVPPPLASRLSCHGHQARALCVGGWRR